MNMNMGPGAGGVNMPNMARFNSIPPEQPNPLHITFQNPQWPPNSITTETVLHYFCDQNNTFYDRTSDNEQLKMQNMGLQNLGSINQDLTRMTGIQYVLHSSCPPLYVICKQKRNSQVNVTPLCYYYVLNGVIHQSPDLYSVVQSRLVGAVEPLKKALQLTLEMSRFNVTKGYSWDFKSEPAKQKRKATKGTDDEDGEMGAIEEAMRTRATPYQSVRTEMLLRLLHDQFPGDSQASNPSQTNIQRPASSTADAPSSLAAVDQRSVTDSPAFNQQQTSGQESGPPQSNLSSLHANQSIDLPPILPNLPPGASQMANDALSRLQSQINQQQQRHEEEMKMETDSSNN